MQLEFHHFPSSPPSRALLMTLKALGVKFDTKIVNLFAGEHKKPDYLKINPLGKIPAMKDGKVNMHESRAIAAYLCNKYAKGDKKTLYPSDPDARLQVDMALYVSEWMFDTTIGYLNVPGVLFRGEKMAEEKLPQVKEMFQLVEDNLQKRKYIAANHVTIADFFTITALTFLRGGGFQGFDSYPKVVDWIKRMEKLPYYDDCNAEGLKSFTEAFQAKLSVKTGTGF